MAERDSILIALIQEVLGPRNGPYEILPAAQDPRNEYITGVLAPAQLRQPPEELTALQEEELVDIDEEFEEASSEEDQDIQGFTAVPGVFSPALDPKSSPRSIGLSFTVEGDAHTPAIEVCATWARYHAHEQGWERQPFSFLTGAVLVDQSAAWAAGPGVRLQLRSRSVGHRRWRVSIFLVNETTIAESKWAETADYVFQPQIRVSCCPGTLLLPVQSEPLVATADVAPGSLAEEDATLALLYQNRAAFARGHLCGAVWKAIDPELPHPNIQAPQQAPYYWIDSVVVPETERAKFVPADVRTDMVPCYSVTAPSMRWDSRYGAGPVLDPEQLAEAWSPDTLQAYLRPLVDGYENWIADQRTIAQSFSVEQQSLALANLGRCQQAANRMAEAIEVLVTDPDVRLAFCFANKAIAVQSRWNNARRGLSDEVFNWRPFQLAFILLNIPALANLAHSDRRICDLLWFPTGGGKTEAYLGLAAFTLALRRRRACGHPDGDYIGAGVGVLSRYTLRLLTIQQFRRALGVITACEYLRVCNLDVSAERVGWRPRGYPGRETFLWGGVRFSAGLWVGGGVTPNNLLSVGPVPAGNGMVIYRGAVDILQGERVVRQGQIRQEGGGEPAQVLNCPCCDSILAVPDEDGFSTGQHTLHLMFSINSAAATSSPSPSQLQPGQEWVTVDAVQIEWQTDTCATISLTFSIPEGRALNARDIDTWWEQVIKPTLGRGVELIPARASRPGYVILRYTNSRNQQHPYNFEIYCPSPSCALNQQAWAEQVPLQHGTAGPPAAANRRQLMFPGTQAPPASLPNSFNMQWRPVVEQFRLNNILQIGHRIPIPAYTVDDQIYHHCPSLVIATVDKFARLAFEPKAASLFGNVDHYHSLWGYYREGCPPSSGGQLQAGYKPHPPGYNAGITLRVPVAPFLPPDLILQDELHLIEGPLGSMVGLYETAIDLLCQREVNGETIVPKYVTSTATVRQASTQVQALFDRDLAQFPPSAILADERFFARDSEVHPLEAAQAGRLYVAICAPGKGAQTPIVRIWSALLQAVFDRWQCSQSEESDRFYTLVGYFNAIRELAGALSLYRQDIPERLSFRAENSARPLHADRILELSSRASSLRLPSLLKRLEATAPDAPDAVLATSMFGTGVDVDRLSLMVVHGQPKTTASYIQATGRVGRKQGGLVVTFFRASRPRDLDHYEFFTGYHRALYRYVEPVTVAPFSPRARERVLGPLAVTLLRHARTLGGQSVAPIWKIEQRILNGYFSNAVKMGTHRYDAEVQIIPLLFETRAVHQPEGRQPPPGVTEQEAASELDRWAQLAQQISDPNQLVYSEPAVNRTPTRAVVLGDAQHHAQGLPEAFENAPQSLRDVEDTTGFKA